jgi:hypothetical protein
MTPKHLFILCPPASGSTLLWKLITTSPQVSAFRLEGQALAKSQLFTRDRWNAQKPIDWEKVKETWRAAWDLSKPVLLEKSPPHLVRAGQLAAHFPNSYFIVMVRDPYAFCEGVKRRWGSRKSFLSGFTYFNLARFWAICARYQIANQKNLENTLFLSYEELTGRPAETARRLLAFVPELKNLDWGQEFSVFEKSRAITNLNDQQIARLRDGQLFEINQALKRCPGLLAHFGYPFREPRRAVSFKLARKIISRLASLNRQPPAVRRHQWKEGEKR